jgi:hypothetical protein
MLKLKFAMMS